MGDPFNAIFKSKLVEKREEKSYFLDSTKNFLKPTKLI